MGYSIYAAKQETYKGRPCMSPVVEFDQGADIYMPLAVFDALQTTLGLEQDDEGFVRMPFDAAATAIEAATVEPHLQPALERLRGVVAFGRTHNATHFVAA